MGWSRKKRRTVNASEFTDVLQGVLADVLRDYGPAMEKHLAAAHTFAERGEVAAEVLALAVSFVAQVCTLTFRQKGSDVAPALNLWMRKVCERLPDDRWLPARATEYSGVIMEDLGSLDECLAGRVTGIYPFKCTIALFLGRPFEKGSRLPTAAETADWKQFSLETLVPAAGFLTDGFQRFAEDIDVENFIPVTR